MLHEWLIDRNSPAGILLNPGEHSPQAIEKAKADFIAKPQAIARANVSRTDALKIAETLAKAVEDTKFFGYHNAFVMDNEAIIGLFNKDFWDIYEEEMYSSE